MSDAKITIAKNITSLRQAHGMTQIDLANELHYSDKAVSKWERGESVPEINTLVAIAELFGVSLDYLIAGKEPVIVSNESDDAANVKSPAKRHFTNKVVITSLSILLVWLIATLVYVVIDTVAKMHSLRHLSCFAYAVPASLIVWLVFNSIWFKRRRNYLIISLLVWALIAAIYLTFILLNINIPQLFLIGIPAQLIIVVWSKMQFHSVR